MGWGPHPFLVVFPNAMQLSILSGLTRACSWDSFTFWRWKCKGIVLCQDETSGVAQEEEFQSPQCVGITTNILRPTVSVFNTVTGPNFFHKYFRSVIWREDIRLIDNMSLKSASSSPVNIIGKCIFSLQRGKLHVCVRFGVVNIFAVQPVVRNSLIDQFFKRMFANKWCIFLIRPRPVSIISEWTSPLDPLAPLQNISATAPTFYDRKDSDRSTPLLRLATSL